jgi:hypothetical protein
MDTVTKPTAREMLQQVLEALKEYQAKDPENNGAGTGVYYTPYTKASRSMCSMGIFLDKLGWLDKDPKQLGKLRDNFYDLVETRFDRFTFNKIVHSVAALNDAPCIWDLPLSRGKTVSVARLGFMIEEIEKYLVDPGTSELHLVL